MDKIVAWVVAGGTMLVLTVFVAGYLLTREPAVVVRDTITTPLTTEPSSAVAVAPTIEGSSTSGSSDAVISTSTVNASLKEAWAKIEAEMRTAGKSEEDIALSKSDFYSYIGSILFLSIQTDTTLTAAEKTKKLEEVLSVIPKAAIQNKKNDCPYTEEKLPLQEMFKGATVKFSKPMLYLVWNDPFQKGCTPTRAAAKYLLESTESWNSIIFDKSKIKEIPVDSNTTFTVEGRIQVTRGGLFGEKNEYYVLRDDKGNLVAPPVNIFDVALFPPESGSNLYGDGKYIGHIVYDRKTKIIWIAENGVPVEVRSANATVESANFTTPASRKVGYIKRVMYATDEGKFKDFTTAESIALGQAEDIYEIQDGKIINDYGGEVKLNNEDTDIMLTFSGIPSGYKCHEMYFIDDPSMYGFTQTYIDGVLKYFPTMDSKTMADFDKKVCYSGKSTVNITFKGSVNKIKTQASFMRSLMTNPYDKMK